MDSVRFRVYYSHASHPVGESIDWVDCAAGKVEDEVDGKSRELVDLRRRNTNGKGGHHRFQTEGGKEKCEDHHQKTCGVSDWLCLLKAEAQL